MAKNVVVSLFKVESEAYQALTELRNNPGDEKNLLIQAALVKKEKGTLSSLDGFDTGAETMNDTAVGGLTGALIGILGGPIGVLLGGAFGMLIGSAFDSGDAVGNACVIEQIAGKMDDGDIAIIGVATEEDESVLDQKLQKYDTIIVRFDAAVVEAEVTRAVELAQEMAIQAREELRAQKKAERKEKRDEKKAEMAAKHAAKEAKKEAKKAEKKAEKKAKKKEGKKK